MRGTVDRRFPVQHSRPDWHGRRLESAGRCRGSLRRPGLAGAGERQLPRRHRSAHRSDHGAADDDLRPRRQSGAGSLAAVVDGQAAGHREEPGDGRREHRRHARRPRRLASARRRPRSGCCGTCCQGSRAGCSWCARMWRIATSSLPRRRRSGRPRGGCRPAAGMRSDPFTGEQDSHEGLDISADRGSAVFATANGTVATASHSGAYGNLIVVDHGYGLETRYGHLQAFRGEARTARAAGRADRNRRIDRARHRSAPPLRSPRQRPHPQPVEPADEPAPRQRELAVHGPQSAVHSPTTGGARARTDKDRAPRTVDREPRTCRATL